MAKYRILDYPDPKLKRTGIKVEDFNSEIHDVINNMFETHYGTENCAALAATQLDMPIPWHITVIDFSAEKNQPLCLVNAEIIEREGEHIETEGCMSVYPNYVHAKVKRATKIKVKAQDRHGKPFEMEADGFMAKCIQHELDHLDGKVYLDKLSNIKRDMVLKKINRVRKALHKQANPPE